MDDPRPIDGRELVDGFTDDLRPERGRDDRIHPLPSLPLEQQIQQTIEESAVQHTALKQHMMTRAHDAAPTDDDRHCRRLVCCRAMESTLHSTRMSRTRLLRFLDELDETHGQFISAYLTAESVQSGPSVRPGRGVGDERLAQISEAIEDEAVQREARRYGTGLVLFHSAASLHVIAPPLPVREDKATEGPPDTGVLRKMLGDQFRVGLVLVTWGAYNAAVFQGSQRSHGKKGTGHIHPHHKKGGSSQARFQRRTQEQRREFLKRVGARIDTEFEGEDIDYVFFGGNRLILKPLAEHSLFMRRAADKRMPRILNVERADREGMETAIEDAFTSIVLRP